MELDFGQTETKASIIDFVKQARKKTASVPKSEFIESNSPIAKIRNIIALTQERLGKHKDDYILIQDEVTLQSYIDKAVSNGVIAIDTETTGLDPILDNLVGVCIYTPTEKAAYIPINHVGYVSGARLQGQLSEDVVAEQLKRCLGIKSIFFNAKFDIRVMKNHLGLNFVPAWDGSIAAKVLNEIEEENNLKYLHKKYCGNLDEAHYTFEKMFKGLTFSLIPIDTAYLYAAHDAIITYELYQYQEGLLGDSPETCPVDELRKLSFVYHKIELPLITVVADMEENGICLDVDFAKELSVEYHELLDKAEVKFRKACDIHRNQIQKYKIKHKDCKLSNPINVNSPVQLAILFYDILQCKSPSKKEPRGTGSDILKVFDNDLSKAILEYREIAKLLSTYIDKLPEVINTKTNRIHASFHQYGTDTGRFSSSDPNLQNIPSHNKKIRKMFTATKGYKLLSADFSQQEPGITSHISDDPKMIDAFVHGRDIYATIASVAFGRDYLDCLGPENMPPDCGRPAHPEGKKYRSKAKAVVLGICYGKSIPAIAEDLGITKKEAQEVYDKVMSSFVNLKKLMDESQEMARKLGYVETIYGRRRHILDMQLEPYVIKYVDNKYFDPFFDSKQLGVVTLADKKINYYLNALNNCTWFEDKKKLKEQIFRDGFEVTDNTKKIGDATRQCVNSRVQGSAADLSKMAMYLVGTDERLKNLGFRLLLMVHDEVIGECPEENVAEVSRLLSEIMVGACKDLKVPAHVDVDVSFRWYENE